MEFFNANCFTTLATWLRLVDITPGADTPYTGSYIEERRGVRLLFFLGERCKKRSTQLTRVDPRVDPSDPLHQLLLPCPLLPQLLVVELAPDLL